MYEVCMENVDIDCTYSGLPLGGETGGSKGLVHKVCDVPRVPEARQGTNSVRPEV